VGGLTGVNAEIIPFAIAVGDRAELGGLNIVGLKRRGFSRDDIHNLRTAYRLLFAQEGTMAERLDDVSALYKDSGPVMEIVAFIRGDSARPICQPKSDND
jgi:UDP-N-acetylglucosamine acyltransferase